MDRRLKTRSISRCSQKTYSGTFRTKPERSNTKYIWIGLITLVVLFFLAIFLLLSSFFNFKKIDVTGLDDYKKLKIEEIISSQQDTRVFLFSQKNLVFFSKNKLNNSLAEFNFLNLEIKKNFFKKKLTVDIKERAKAVIFLEEGSYYFIDREGNIITKQTDCNFKSTPTEVVAEILATSTATNTIEVIASSSDQKTSEEKPKVEENLLTQVDMASENCLNFNEEYRRDNLYPFIENIGKNRITENKKNIKLDSKYIDFSLNLYNDLNTGDAFSLNKIVLDEEYNTIKARLNNNIDLYFSFNSDYSEQISRFFTLKREKGAELSAKKYIDLRYGDKIFYY